MTTEGRAELARDETANADEELRAAAKLIETGFPRVSVTRAYFAVFHMARAVMYSHDFSPKSHKGLLHLLNRHFVKTGKLTVADARVLAHLQEYRGQADYGGFYVGNEETAREDVASAISLCAKLRALLA